MGLERLFIELKALFLGVAANWLPEGLLLTFLSALIVGVAVLGVAVAAVMFLTWLERKVVARIQDRYGPNRVGPAGLFQPVADGIKMVLKEDIVPTGADRVVHFLAPVLALPPVLMLLLVIPFGRDMVAADLNVGLLFFLGVSAMQTPMVIAAGWGGRSKYSVLGSMRTAAQILTYEIPMVIVVVAVVMMTDSSDPMKTSEIVSSQVRPGVLGWLTGWNVFTPWGFAGLIVFFLSAAAEANRTPFDMAEAESELVGGFHTEYSGFKFALFQMAEFLGAFAAGALAVTMFLGGWQGPGFLPSWVWFAAKAVGMFMVLIWFRGTLPRFRIDQLLSFSWKFLFPMSLLVVAGAACWFHLPRFPAIVANVVLLFGGYALFSAILFADFRRASRPRTG